MTLSDDPACNEIVELVTEFLDDRLPPADRALFERHLAVCPPCATYLAQIRTTARLTGRVGADALTPEAREGFLALLRKWKSRHGGDAGRSPPDGA